MTFVLLLALLQEPSIESVRTLTGGVARSGCWLPVEVVVRGPFAGDVIVSTDIGVRFSKNVQVPAGASQGQVIPAIVLMGGAPVNVTLRSTLPVIPRQLDPPVTLCSQNDLIVGVVGGEAATFDLGEGRHAYCVPWTPADWSDPAMLEAFDVIVGDPKAAPLGLFKTQGGVVLPKLDGVASLRPIRAYPSARFECVDELIRPMMPADPWIEGKRPMACRLLAFMMLVFFGGFSWVILKKPTPGWLAGTISIALAVTVALSVLFPRDWRFSVTWEAVTDDAAIQLKWIQDDGMARGSAGFDGLPKPVFASIDEAKQADFEIRRLGSGRFVADAVKMPQCFLSIPPDKRLAGLTASRSQDGIRIASESGPRRLQVLVGNLNSGPWVVGPGHPGLVQVTRDEAVPDSADYRFFARRLVHGDCLFGWNLEEDRVDQEMMYFACTGYRFKPPFVVKRID